MRKKFRLTTETAKWSDYTSLQQLRYNPYQIEKFTEDSVSLIIKMEKAWLIEVDSWLKNAAMQRSEEKC